MSLVELGERIAIDRDRHALKELHDNRVLCYRRGGDSLRLVEYIQMLSEGSLARRWCGCDPMAVVKAYDLTVDKFSRLTDEQGGTSLRRSQGPDCGYYYAAFITHITARLKADPPANSIEAEMRASQSLRKLVARHFYLSCLESRRRSQRLVRRYLWKLDGRALYLWLPLEMPGRQCRRWLEANIPDVDPNRPGEQQRVQARVDRLLGRPRVLSVENALAKAGDIAVETDPAGALIEQEMQSRGLARTIADEKAENIALQRPAISRLGAEGLRQLVQVIFDGLMRGDFRADRIAESFGLSKATFSRFAGSRWQSHSSESTEPSIPDLWRNTARTLARHPGFVAAAKRAGVWSQVTDVLNAVGPGGRYGDE